MTRKVTRRSDQQPKTQSKSHDEKGKGPMMTVNAGIIVVAITPPCTRMLQDLPRGWHVYTFSDALCCVERGSVCECVGVGRPDSSIAPTCEHSDKADSLTAVSFYFRLHPSRQQVILMELSTDNKMRTASLGWVQGDVDRCEGCRYSRHQSLSDG